MRKLAKGKTYYQGVTPSQVKSAIIKVQRKTIEIDEILRQIGHKDFSSFSVHFRKSYTEFRDFCKISMGEEV